MNQINCRNIFAFYFKRYDYVIMKFAQNLVKSVCPIPQNKQFGSEHWEVEKISETNKTNEFWKFESLEKFQRWFSIILPVKNTWDLKNMAVLKFKNFER